jgi:hypothetical protein
LLFYNSTSRCCSAGGSLSSALSSHTSWLVAGSTLALALSLALALLLLLLLFWLLAPLLRLRFLSGICQPFLG